jgi:hypothetical protein
MAERAMLSGDVVELQTEEQLKELLKHYAAEDVHSSHHQSASLALISFSRY